MSAAVAASLFALGTALGGFAVARRELTRAYLDTRPASATIELDAVDDALVEKVRAIPGIAEAEARATIRARIRVGEDWCPLLLFVVADFERMRLSTFAPHAGAWPPPPGTMLIDHLGVSVARAGVGDQVVIKTPRGRPTPVRISGLVWDSSLAPAVMERTVWGYITPETLASLGQPGTLDELKIVVENAPLQPERIEATTRSLVQWLRSQGRSVEEVQIPPPGRHPHQGQMEAVMLMLIGFAFLALLLSGILVGTTVEAMMARQVREIGAMKAIGARSAQLAGMYLVMMVAVGAGALIVATPLGALAARGLLHVVAHNLNIKIASAAIPAWVFIVQGAAGLLIPVAAAAVPVMQTSRMTVQRALRNVGTTKEVFGERPLDAWLSRRRGLGPIVTLGLRNAFRRRGRLALTVLLLAAAGAMFITGLNLPRAWSRRLDEVNTSRRYDVAIRLQQLQSDAAALAIVRAVPGVARAEAWGTMPASWDNDVGVPVVHTYPDKGHGAFQVVGVPLDTTMVAFPVLEGRWLAPGDTEVVVLNHMASGNGQGAKVGDTVTIAAAGGRHSWRVVGLVRDLGSPATAYVSDEAFARASGVRGMTKSLVITMEPSADAERADVIRRVERSLERAGMGIDVSISARVLRSAVGEHMAVMLGLILALSGLMTLVGVLGLTAAMSIAVLERTRELGVMQAVGATPGMVLRVVLTEGIFAGVCSAVGAIALAVPWTALVGTVVGNLAFRVPLPLAMSPTAVLIWLVAAVLFSALATAFPARRASRMTVREALAYA
jgi:putative ABC transport system permease protein